MSDFLYLGASSSHIIIKTYDVMWFTKIKLFASWTHGGLNRFMKELSQKAWRGIFYYRFGMRGILYLKMNEYQDHVGT